MTCVQSPHNNFADLSVVRGALLIKSIGTARGGLARQVLITAQNRAFAVCINIVVAVRGASIHTRNRNKPNINIYVCRVSQKSFNS